MMRTHKQVVGRWGENIVVEFLEKKGYTVMDRNVRAAHGEIDIVALIDDLLVFVEVRTRSSHAFAIRKNRSLCENKPIFSLQRRNTCGCTPTQATVGNLTSLPWKEDPVEMRRSNILRISLVDHYDSTILL